jgi:hypothetical protein
MDTWRFIWVYALVVIVVGMLPIIGNAHAEQGSGVREVKRLLSGNQASAP